MNTSDFYALLQKMSGEKCYTLSNDNPAEMEVDRNGITVLYPSGSEVFLPREMVEHAIRELISRGELSVDEVHIDITKKHRTRTDKLMAVVRKLPGVTIQKYPRKLFYKINRP